MEGIHILPPSFACKRGAGGELPEKNERILKNEQ
jgi:hypothetical protein